MNLFSNFFVVIAIGTSFTARAEIPADTSTANILSIDLKINRYPKTTETTAYIQEGKFYLDGKAVKLETGFCEIQLNKGKGFSDITQHNPLKLRMAQPNYQNKIASMGNFLTDAWNQLVLKDSSNLWFRIPAFVSFESDEGAIQSFRCNKDSDIPSQNHFSLAEVQRLLGTKATVLVTEIRKNELIKSFETTNVEYANDSYILNDPKNREYKYNSKYFPTEVKIYTGRKL